MEAFKSILIASSFLMICSCQHQQETVKRPETTLGASWNGIPLKGNPAQILLGKAPTRYIAKPIPVEKISQEPFNLKKHQFYKNLLQKELERTGTDDPQIIAYVDRYCTEMISPVRITFDDGMYPAADRTVIRDLCEEGQRLIDDGLTHPVIYYCYYDTFIRSGYDLFTYSFNDRKKIAQAGFEACQTDPQTHPLLTYAFCNEMRMRAPKDEKKQWIDRMHNLFPKIFYPESIGTELTDVSADLLYQLLRWAQPPEDRRIDADRLMNDPNVPEWIGLYADGDVQHRIAWKNRGGGFADAVTVEGWEGFREYEKKARVAWTKAWELRPDLPEAPRKMIGVARAGSIEPNESRKWFDRTLAARVDDRDAYDDYSWSLMERWCGSMDKTTAFAQECVETDRYDTCIPFLATTVLYWSYFDQNYPDTCPDRESFAPIFERLFEGYRTAEYLKGEDRTAVLSWIAALAVDAEAYELGHQIFETINYQRDHRYFRKEAGLYFGDYIWMAWCNSGPAADLIAQARQNAENNQNEKARELYEQILASPSIPSKAFDRIVTEKYLIDFRQAFASGDWVNIYSGDTPPEWLEPHSHWSRTKDGWLQSETENPAGWLPVEMSLIEGFELEMDVGNMKLGKQHDTYIYLCNPGWHDFQRLHIKLSGKKGRVQVMPGRNKSKKVEPTADFKPTGNDRIRVVVKNKKIGVKINDEVILENISIPSHARYEEKIGLMLGDHNRGKYNTQNRYNNIRIRKTPTL